MRIKLITSLLTANGCIQSGDELEVDDDYGSILVENGDAEPVAVKPLDKLETRTRKKVA